MVAGEDRNPEGMREAPDSVLNITVLHGILWKADAGLAEHPGRDARG
jgi:hypothetical protein